MNENNDLTINDKWVVSMRGGRNSVNLRRPYAWLVEKERTHSGAVEDTAIIFLTNRECTYKCLMCDLWKNTTDANIPAGAIPEQIGWALEQMPAAKHLKLYNSGSFFDRRAIPPSEYSKIASLVSQFESLTVECHPNLVGDLCLDLRDQLKPELQVALGLETVNTDLLKRLNKKMTLEDFSQSVGFLKDNNILSRAFILLRPPFLTEEEGIFWAEKSLEFAFSAGVECCTVIPVRAGNGAMEYLQGSGMFSSPELKSLEKVLEYGIGLKSGRVFADLWDLRLFSDCPDCFDRRAERLNIMNLTQKIPKKINCTCQ